MRLDKFLKVSRVIKRRTVANEISSNGRVWINSKLAKPSTEVKVGDLIEIKFGSGLSRIRVPGCCMNSLKKKILIRRRFLPDPVRSL
jgi:ribosomal 50S subunit-recycling heat shock protein